MDRSCWPVRVQHVPAAHPYTRSISGPAATFLPDPAVPGAPAGQWWPPTALRPEWVAEATDHVDVVHLHFGFEHLTPAQARAWVSALRRHRVGLAFTVHDLVNPHLRDQRGHEDLLDVLVPAADVLTTLTSGAAARIRQRWGREAVVHPHPLVVAPAWVERPRRTASVWTVGVHLKSLRANIDLDAVLRAIEVVRELGDAVLRVHVHADVLDTGHPRHDPRLATILAAHGGHVDVRVHDPLDDAALWSDLLATDLALLPYRHGTHSGWLEMCHDLGTEVLAADVGDLNEQHPIRSYTSLDDLAGRLVAAHEAHRAGIRPERPSAAARLAERDIVARLHTSLHRDLARRVGG